MCVRDEFFMRLTLLEHQRSNPIVERLVEEDFVDRFDKITYVMVVMV